MQNKFKFNWPVGRKCAYMTQHMKHAEAGYVFHGWKVSTYTDRDRDDNNTELFGILEDSEGDIKFVPYWNIFFDQDESVPWLMEED